PAGTVVVFFAATALRRASIGRPRATMRSAASSANAPALATTASNSSCTPTKLAPRTCQCACLALMVRACSPSTTGERNCAAAEATSGSLAVVWTVLDVVMLFSSDWVCSRSDMYNATGHGTFRKQDEAVL